MQNATRKKIAVLYHGNCRDGFSGAWAAWKKFGVKADYFPMIYGAKNQFQSVPRGLKNKIVYLIDISFKGPGAMEKLVRENERVVVLDHHHDAVPSMKLASEMVFNNNMSGATVAWKYFFPKKPAPLLLKYVQDLDIWQRKMPDTFAVSAYLDLFDYGDFKAWSKLVAQLENKKTRQEIIKNGKLLLSFIDKKVKEIVEKATVLVDFDGNKTLAVNSSNWFSEIGHLLVQKKPPMAVIWKQVGDELLISMRSNGKFDVSKIARKFGGGGHKAAAAFSRNINEGFPWKILGKYEK